MVNIKPFIKWVGGKRQLLPEIRKYIPENFGTYYEPFVGAGAVFLDISPQRALISDANKELINCYQEIRDHYNCVISHLETFDDSEEAYYRIRDLDLHDNYGTYSSSFKAARMIYLNKTDFNGLYRVNSKGHFNVPYGKHENKFVINYDGLKEISEYLNNNLIAITSDDFEKAVESALPGDFIYFDPPYDPVSETSNFTKYTSDGFTKQDQIRLRDCFVKLTERGCKCLLSNAGTDFIKDIYKDYNIVEVQANRAINSVGSKRGKVTEVLVMNYNNE
jgi:DNA adenine methylase